ncbi:hypothetical protein [Parathalassolituus penaei]|uniref:Uncharacterized protein n=1 Tax=Parathalassolituus penaei TaxID=2997323 RepID=A0A9X3EHL8_9GAMM|nr:hypothetical protein [Parathalassolituus penaei]MCY0966880.1 hypothetical protein [Parathalassolituus penaei]
MADAGSNPAISTKYQTPDDSVVWGFLLPVVFANRWFHVVARRILLDFLRHLFRHAPLPVQPPASIRLHLKQLAVEEFASLIVQKLHVPKLAHHMNICPVQVCLQVCSTDTTLSGIGQLVIYSPTS